MRVAFAGTPEFAARALDALVAARHCVGLVLTQPDRRAGRGMHLRPSPVAERAAHHGLAIAKPSSLKDALGRHALLEYNPEVLVVAAYGLILPPVVLEIPRLGCVNIHASLLPRWRGAAPIHRAILAGDGRSGISIMRMDAGLDTGPVLLAEELVIGARETSGSLHDRLAEMGAELVVRALASLPQLQAQPQDNALATYAPKVSKAEARIDWGRSAGEIDRQVRAFNPAPGAEGRVGDEVLKIWSALPVEHPVPIGKVVREGGEGLFVGCAQGSLRLLEVQRPGGRRLQVHDFLRGAAKALKP